MRYNLLIQTRGRIAQIGEVAMLNYTYNNSSSNTLISGANGLDLIVADTHPIRFGGAVSNRGDTFPLFYACGFYEALDAFARQHGSGCLPSVVVFRTKAEADAYVEKKVISVRRFVAQDNETIDLLVKRFGLKS